MKELIKTVNGRSQSKPYVVGPTNVVNLYIRYSFIRPVFVRARVYICMQEAMIGAWAVHLNGTDIMTPTIIAGQKGEENQKPTFGIRLCTSSFFGY